MKKKYIIIAFMLFLLNIETISAACTQEEINSFKRIEDEYTIKYELDKSTKTYNLYFDRTKPNMYDFIIYTDKSLNCEDLSDTKIKCISFTPGEYKITINGQTDTCNDTLKTINLKLPKYNKLSEDPLCKGIEEFVLCNPSYDKEIDYETFVSRVETYKKNHNTTSENDTSENDNKSKDNEVLNKVTNYLKDNWIEITVIAVFIILVIVTFIITAKSIRKSRRLE